MKFLSSSIKKEQQQTNNDQTTDSVKVMVEPISDSEQTTAKANLEIQNVTNKSSENVDQLDQPLNQLSFTNQLSNQITDQNDAKSSVDELDGLIRKRLESFSTNISKDEKEDNDNKATEDISYKSIIKETIKKFIFSLVVVLVCYLFGYLKLSFAWILISLLIYIVYYIYQLRSRIRLLAGRALMDEKKFIERALVDLPNWVILPDHERVEFLNQSISKFWPYIDLFLQRFLKDVLLPNIKTYLPDLFASLKFDTIDLGTIPLRVTGIKCHDSSRTELIYDIQIMYAGNASFKMKFLKFVAGVKDCQLFGNLRVKLYPLTQQIPFVGAVAFTFLNAPKLDFVLTNLANILDLPGLGDIIRKVILDQICSYFVYPNSYVIPLNKEIPMKLLKFDPPLGVIRLEIIEAKDLLKADYGLLGMGKSDPFCKITVSSFSLQTQVIPNTINPHWNFIAEFAIGDLDDQEIDIEVYDKDQNTADDFLGRLTLRLAEYDCTGDKSHWIPLEDTSTGCLHVKLTWLKLSSDLNKLESHAKSTERIKLIYTNSMQSLKLPHPKSAIASELNEINYGSSFCCMIYLDSIRYLPKVNQTEPSVYVMMILGTRRRKSLVIDSTCNPVFEQNFLFLCDHLKNEPPLIFEIYDLKSKKLLGRTGLRLMNLVKENRLSFDAPITVRIGQQLDCILKVAIELRVLYESGFEARRIKAAVDSVKNVLSMDKLAFDKIELKDKNIIVDEPQDKDNIPSLDQFVLGSIQPILKTMEYNPNVVDPDQPSAGERTKKDIQLNSSGLLEAVEKKVNGSVDHLSERSSNASINTNLINQCDHDTAQIGITLKNLNDIEYKPITVIIHQIINLPGPITKNTFYFVKIRRFPLRTKKQVSTKKVYHTNSPIFNKSFNLMNPKDNPLTQLEFRLFRGRYCKMFRYFTISKQIERVVVDLTQIEENNITKYFELEEFPKQCNRSL